MGALILNSVLVNQYPDLFCVSQVRFSIKGSVNKKRKISRERNNSRKHQLPSTWRRKETYKVETRNFPNWKLTWWWWGGVCQEWRWRWYLWRNMIVFSNKLQIKINKTQLTNVLCLSHTLSFNDPSNPTSVLNAPFYSDVISLSHYTPVCHDQPGHLPHTVWTHHIGTRSRGGDGLREVTCNQVWCHSTSFGEME